MNHESKITTVKTLIAANKALISLNNLETMTPELLKELGSLQRRIQKLTATVLA